MIYEGDPVHPILPDAFRWQLLEFAWRREADWSDTHFDMTFERGGVVRRLRFFGVSDIVLEGGILPNAVGMLILDVSGRQLDNFKVRVVNFEQTGGVPTFWATRVVDRDLPE
jgi:hypothetical protein